MDILIKNIEKPKNCLECQFYLSEYDYCHALKDNLSQKEWETKSRCPLVELPPHGRLIDADNLIRLASDECGGMSYEDALHVVFRCIDNAPTIVEAST